MREVDIKAVNQLFGTVRFLSLKIPEDATVMATIYGSDVTSYRREGDEAYVIFGESYHVIASPNYALDMKVVIRPGRRDLKPRMKVEEDGPIEIGGHLGQYFLGRGFLMDKKRRIVTVHYCDQTDRTIQLSFKGAGDIDLLRFLRGLEVVCHEVERF